MLTPWYWEHFHYQVYAHRPDRLAVRKYVAPGRAKEVGEAMRSRDLHPFLLAHDCLTLYRPEDVVTYLMRSGPSLLMEQALEEYRAACAATRRGRQRQQDQWERCEQAVRGVLALCPDWGLPPGRPKAKPAPVLPSE